MDVNYLINIIMDEVVNPELEKLREDMNKLELRIKAIESKSLSERLEEIELNIRRNKMKIDNSTNITELLQNDMIALSNTIKELGSFTKSMYEVSSGGTGEIDEGLVEDFTSKFEEVKILNSKVIQLINNLNITENIDLTAELEAMKIELRQYLDSFEEVKEQIMDDIKSSNENDYSELEGRINNLIATNTESQHTVLVLEELSDGEK